MKVSIQLLLAVTIHLFALGGCASNPEAPSLDAGAMPPDWSSEALMSHYKIGVGDKIQVFVWGNPQLSIIVPVRPDGMISVPLIQDIKVAGKMPGEVAQEMEKELAAYVKNPNVSIIITELPGYDFLSRVRVTGSVEENLSMPYQPGMTVLDAILEAGGPDEFASPNRTKLHRRMKNRTESYDIKLEDIMDNGDMSTNMYLKPGDILTVPERFF